MLGRKSFASSLRQFETLYAASLVLPSFPVRFIDAGEQPVDSSESSCARLISVYALRVGLKYTVELLV